MKESASPELQAYRQFQVDLLAAKHKGQHTEAEVVEKLLQLFRDKNPYAKSALERAASESSPRFNIANSFWKRAEIEKFDKDFGSKSE